MLPYSMWFLDEHGNETNIEIEQLKKAVYQGDNSWQLENELGDTVILSTLYHSIPLELNASKAD